MNEPLAYLDGKIIPARQAVVLPTDTGFVMGATVAEQLRTFRGKLFQLDEHLRRLVRSLGIVGVDPGVKADDLAAAADELVEHNHRFLAEGDDLGLTIFVTPGVYPAYASGEIAGPTVCLHTYPLPFGLWADKYDAGQALITSDVQQVSGKSWPAALKCRSRMHYYLADRRAAEAEPGARALLLDQGGLVTEASTANVMIYSAALGLLSPPVTKVLPGISLAKTSKMALDLGLPVLAHELTPADVAGADEAFLTSTPTCIIPATRLDGRPIGHGTPGEVTRQLMAAWNDLAGFDVAEQARRFKDR